MAAYAACAGSLQLALRFLKGVSFPSCAASLFPRGLRRFCAALPRSLREFYFPLAQLRRGLRCFLAASPRFLKEVSFPSCAALLFPRSLRGLRRFFAASPRFLRKVHFPLAQLRCFLAACAACAGSSRLRRGSSRKFRFPLAQLRCFLAAYAASLFPRGFAAVPQDSFAGSLRLRCFFAASLIPRSLRGLRRFLAAYAAVP